MRSTLKLAKQKAPGPGGNSAPDHSTASDHPSSFGNGSVEEAESSIIVETPKFIQWITHGSGVYYPEFHVEITKTIPTGFYGIGYDSQAGKYFVRKIDYSTNNIYELPMPEMGKIITDIKKFWKNEEAFRRYGFIYKRGILLYGPPGCGKTNIIQLIIKYLIEQQKGVVFRIETAQDVENYTNFMHSTFKVIEKPRKIVTIIEDIDGLLHSGKGTETLLLNILDGMNHMDNIVYVATTNYPEELSERIINRPSRFDRRYEIGLPTDEVRKFYFEKALLPDDLKSVDLERWVDETKDMSMAHLHELVVSTQIQGNTFEESMEILKDFNSKVPNSKKFGGKGNIGFGATK